MRGRKPKPTAQRRRDGNPGRRPLPANEPLHAAITDAAFDDAPPELADNLAAQDEWRRLAPLLRTARQITDADRAALVALCIEWALYLEARDKAQPRVIASPSGYAMPNPWLAIKNRALAACLKLWPELGLTPSSRTRVDRAPLAFGADPFAEFDQDLS
jgi:P27 family predicted phage terminase small subunit